MDEGSTFTLQLSGRTSSHDKMDQRQVRLSTGANAEEKQRGIRLEPVTRPSPLQ